MQVSDLAIATHDEVWQLEDPDGFVALHRSRNQRTFGGIRIKHYDDHAEALRDVLRLSESMTRKCAINGIPGGGAKAVLVASSIRDRTHALTALGQFVEHLKGRFVTGPDVGLSPDDLAIVQQHTQYVVHEDLSHAAATGVLQAIRGALDATGSGGPDATGAGDSLNGLTVAIQGLGAVGAKLAQQLHEAGARLVVADLDPERCSKAEQTWGARTVSVDAIATTTADVFAPCALGDAVTDDNAGQLNCRIICGAANNVLDGDRTAVLLHRREIVYVPDFLANSGATVQGAWSAIKGPGDYSDRVLAIRDRTRRIVTRAAELGDTALGVATSLIHEWL